MQNKGAIRLFAILLALVSLYQLTFTYVTNSIEDDAKSYAESKADATKAGSLIDSIGNSNGNQEVIDYCVNKIRAIQKDVLTVNELGFQDTIQTANGDITKINQYLDSIKHVQDELKNRREKTYLDSMTNEPVYNFLWLRNFTYSECKQRELNLGLDLKGGMNVTLEISVVDVIRAMAGINSKDSTFVRAIAAAKENQKESNEDFVTLFQQAIKDIDPDIKLATFFQTSELKDKITWETSDEDVMAILRQETDDAIENSFNILRKRIDRFGVTQPNIQRLETAGRVLIELPGIKNPERALKLLQGTAKLEFWETYENSEIFPALRTANEQLISILGDKDATTKNTEEKVEADVDTIEVADANIEADAEQDTTQNEIVDNIEVEDTDTTETEDTTSSLLELVDDVESDTSSTEDITQSDEDFKRNNPLFSVLTPWADRNSGNLGEGPVVGYAMGRDTSKVMKLLNLKQVKALLPVDVKFLWEVKPFDEDEIFYKLIAIKKSRHGDGAPLEGDAITDARADYAQSGGQFAVVYMNMDSDGAKKWAGLTKNNIGKSIAVVLDNYVYSFPTVQDEITGGSSQISGRFTIQEAQDLATLLKSGKLPAPARVESYEIVGPSLGQEAISAGLTSFIFAFLIVMVYMVFYYSARAGMVANFALISNLFFIFGVLASLSAVLTLPGIAGIVLTIGMSVDANVLIYERIREEIHAGKGLKLAIKDGYKNALSAILDANVTTFLTGAILYFFGSGPIQGFATTLMIGILTSLFSAIFITRLVYEWILDKNWKLTFDTKITRNAFKNLKIDFIGRRKVFYVVSSVVIIIGLASLFMNGLNYGIDFKGGRNYIVRFEDKVSTVEIQQSLKEVFGETPEVKTFGKENQVKISTKYKIDEEGINIDNEIDSLMYIGLKEKLGDITFEEYTKADDAKVVGKMSSQKVGPTIVDEIKVDALRAIIFSLIIMFIYIVIRFRNWQFGLGATVALLHDVLFVLSLFSLLYSVMPFSLEIDQAFIAAVLTVVGYSLNDTVVVFDRIREYAGLYTKRERKDIMNTAMNSTVSRTVNTSLTTFVVLLTIFIFGGEVIQGFVFALLIGVIVGTYSSLFVATPLVYDTIKRAETIRVIKGKKVR